MTRAAHTAAATPVAPSFWEVARQPRWIGMLALCLAVAAAFAALGQWQLDSAIRSAQRPAPPSADAPAQPLGDHLQPGRPLYERSIGVAVAFQGVLDPADLEVLEDRLQDGRSGAWIIGRAHVLDDGGGPVTGGIDAAPGMAIAIAWAPDAATAASAVDELRRELPSREELSSDAQSATAETSFEGSLEYGQAPRVPTAGEPVNRLDQMSPAYLVNRWSVPSPSAYSAYVTLSAGLPELPAGTEPISRQAPGADAALNWLNIFYAIEWAIFAGFALYLWWRLVRDETRQLGAAVSAGQLDRLADDIRRERLIAIRDARRAARADPDAAAHRSGASPAGPENGS